MFKRSRLWANIGYAVTFPGEHLARTGIFFAGSRHEPISDGPLLK
jgi:hypothetical protein